MKTAPADSYAGFADLAKRQVRGTDYELIVNRRPASSVAIIAPHGGSIEPGTSRIARAIAGEEFNLYLFEGIKSSGNYAALHLSSSRFDEPSCLQLIAHCSFVVVVHGCVGDDDKVLMGGLDGELRDRLAKGLREAGVTAETQGHRFPARHPNNICNRGLLRKGVQLELTSGLRRSSPAAARAVNAVRASLLGLAAPT